VSPDGNAIYITDPTDGAVQVLNIAPSV
jgi:hypothetical protein